MEGEENQIYLKNGGESFLLMTKKTKFLNLLELDWKKVFLDQMTDNFKVANGGLHLD